MSTLQRAALLSVFFGLIVVGFFAQSDGREVTTTSFGETPKGYRAAYELLRRLAVPVSRSSSDPAALAPGTLWLIDPPRLCGPAAQVMPMDDYGADGTLSGWVRRGGTLVLFLDAGSNDSCDAIAGFDLPMLDPLVCQPGAENDGDPGEQQKAGKPPSIQQETGKSGTVEMTGRLAASPRRLESVLRTFLPGSTWETVLDANGSPFVVERELGDGRIVAIADARVASNQFLDLHDSALLLVDVVRAYGDPTIDEWLHGFRTHESLPLYLLSSPALPVFCGIALLALALAWYGAVVPARTARTHLEPPSLDGSIDALAAAYAATADYPSLHERYRHYASGRLRHFLGMPADTALDVLAGALERRRRIPRDRVHALFDRKAAGERDDMIDQMHRLDQLIQEARP